MLSKVVAGGARRRRTRGASVGVAALAVIALGAGAAAAAGVGSANPSFGTERVGEKDARGVLLPNNQRVAPLGSRTLVTDGRLLSSNLSPSGKRLAALTYKRGVTSVSIFDPTRGRLLQQVPTVSEQGLKTEDRSVSPDGPFYSPDGRSLWVPQTRHLLRFTLRSDGTVAGAPVVIPTADATSAWIPSGMAFTADGATAYVALNGVDELGVLNTATNAFSARIPVGVAPRQVVLAGGRAFVSNEGGRRATAHDTTNLSYHSPVVSSPATGAATTGTVSVVDLATHTQTASLPVGLQPTALSLSGTTLFVANSNSDSVSIINTATARVAQTFNTNPLPGSTVGSNPNAVTLVDPSHLLVSIGRDNAIAEFRYSGQRRPLQYEGLIPTDWYPVNVQLDKATGRVVVTNDKGIGARGPASTITEGPDTHPATGLNTYDDTGSLTQFAPPTDAALGELTHRVFVNDDWAKLLTAAPKPSPTVKPVAVPAHLGDPSTIKHVFLIVKENRTYDQVLGDVGKGNSDPSLTQFGGSVTPNQHLLARTYPLFDNFYDEGTLSADGHNWLMQANANDYIEREFGAFERSYPAQGGDALAYQPNGFLWNAAEKAGNTVRDFGEYANFFTGDVGANWSQLYQDSQILEGKAKGPLPVPVNKFVTYSDIPSLNAILDKTYPRFDLDVPDQYRADIWLKSFRQSEQTGKLANLNMLWVPNDHTSGTSGNDPFPTAAVADNDLAVGRIISAISHSTFWKSSAVFVLEDDSQNGTDHVDGHRAPLYVASPYAVRGRTVDTYYTQLNVVKTIEQILGIAPMNQMDRAAEPMRDAFTNVANTTAFTTQPNQIPLTFGLGGLVTPTPPAAAPHTSGARRGSTSDAGPTPSAAATPAVSASVPAAELGVYRQWQVWSSHQQFSGAHASEDAATPAQLNRLDWYASTGWTRPYPGDKAVLGPYQVPGWDVPAAELGG